MAAHGRFFIFMAVQEQPPANNQVQSLPDHVLPVVPILDAPRSEEQLLALSEAWGFNDALLELPQEVLPPIDTPADKYQALRQQALHGHIQGHKLANYQALIAELEALDDDYAKADGNRRKQRDVRDVQELVLNDIVRLRYGRKKPIANSANSPSEDPINGTGIATAALGTVVPRKNALSAKARLLLGATAVATVVSGCGEAPVGPVLLAPAPDISSEILPSLGEPQATRQPGILPEPHATRDYAAEPQNIDPGEISILEWHTATAPQPEPTPVPDKPGSNDPTRSQGIQVDTSGSSQSSESKPLEKCQLPDGRYVPVLRIDTTSTVGSDSSPVQLVLYDALEPSGQISPALIKMLADQQVAYDDAERLQRFSNPILISFPSPFSDKGRIAVLANIMTPALFNSEFGMYGPDDIFVHPDYYTRALPGMSVDSGRWVVRNSDYNELLSRQDGAFKAFLDFIQLLEMTPIEGTDMQNFHGNFQAFSIVGDPENAQVMGLDGLRVDVVGSWRRLAPDPTFTLSVTVPKDGQDKWINVVQQAILTGSFDFDRMLSRFPDHAVRQIVVTVRKEGVEELEVAYVIDALVTPGGYSVTTVLNPAGLPSGVTGTFGPFASEICNN